jgi:hypothetical protein
MQESLTVGISLPERIIKKRYNKNRQENVPKSRLVMRLENSYLKYNFKIDSLDLGLKCLKSRESFVGHK